MKIEKVKSNLKKAFNRVMGVLLPVATLFVSCGTNALIVRAEEESEKIYTLTCSNDYIHKVGNTETRYVKNYTLSIKGKQIVGILGKHETSDTREILADTISFYSYDEKNRALYGFSYSGWNSIVSFSGNFQRYDNGKLAKEGELLKQETTLYLKGYKEYIVNSYSIKGDIKYFDSEESAKKYFISGDTSGMIELDKDIDDGIKDPDIGYLHNLQMNQLQTGKQDENGIYELYSDRFTWDDTYPEYDSSYLVEVRGKCVVQTRGFLGFGKTKTYTSDIENIAKDISYKDLEWIISSQDKFAPFNSFINEHMPTNLVMTGVYGMRDLYFRIYKWSDADECYHYGPWVNMHFIDDDVWISVDGDTTLGDFDKDGNFIVNPDSDYGTGKKNDVGVGVGDTIEDAKKDNDRRNEEKKNDDGKLDLSNASISDIWYWFVTSLSNLYNSLGFIPEFFQKIFSFLPTPIYVFLGIGIVVAILLRVLGR